MMIEYLNVTKTLSVNSDQAWSLIRAIGGLELWFPAIASCRVSGAGVGAERAMSLRDGAGIIDRIDEINDAERRFRYTRTVAPFACSRYLGTVEVRDDNGNTTVSWTLELDVDQAARDELVAFLTDALSDGITGLERYIKAQADIDDNNLTIA
ncbi:MAG: SRPBCC family protein [Methylovulum sp.]|nr:SRPBCC family protein [Methylovulum sp.]